MIKKYIICFLSVLLLSVSSISFSAFADDTYPETAEGYLSYIYNTFGYNGYNYIVYSYVDGMPRFGCILFPSSVSEVEFTDEKCLTVPSYNRDGSYYNNGSFSGGSFGNGNSFYTSWNYLKNRTIVLSSVNIKYNGEEVYKVPSDAPFTVSYSPELFTDMTPNVITYPSKQGANGETVTDELYDIKVTVSLTEDFLNIPVISGSFIYSYQFTTFIVPSDFCTSENISLITSNAIYTCTHYGKFYYDDYHLTDTYVSNDSGNVLDNAGLGVLGQSTGIKSSSDTSVCAEGRTNCFVISRDVPSVSFTISAQDVPFENSGFSSFKIVTLGRLSCLTQFGDIPMPYYFKSSCPDLAFKSKKVVPLEFGDDEHEPQTIELYDYYTVLSDDFSYVTYPAFIGNSEIEKPIDFNNRADRMQDYAMHMQTGGMQEWRTPDEFTEYRNQLAWAENFSTDFGVGTISDILNGESNFFHFLTASISVLPSWFLTILGSFFVTLLALVVIRFVL